MPSIWSFCAFNNDRQYFGNTQLKNKQRTRTEQPTVQDTDEYMSTFHNQLDPNLPNANVKGVSPSTLALGWVGSNWLWKVDLCPSLSCTVCCWVCVLYLFFLLEIVGAYRKLCYTCYDYIPLCCTAKKFFEVLASQVLQILILVFTWMFGTKIGPKPNPQIV